VPGPWAQVPRQVSFDTQAVPIPGASPRRAVPPPAPRRAVPQPSQTVPPPDVGGLVWHTVCPPLVLQNSAAPAPPLMDRHPSIDRATAAAPIEPLTKQAPMPALGRLSVSSSCTASVNATVSVDAWPHVGAAATVDATPSRHSPSDAPGHAASSGSPIDASASAASSWSPIAESPIAASDDPGAAAQHRPIAASWHDDMRTPSNGPTPRQEQMWQDAFARHGCDDESIAVLWSLALHSQLGLTHAQHIVMKIGLRGSSSPEPICNRSAYVTRCVVNALEKINDASGHITWTDSQNPPPRTSGRGHRHRSGWTPATWSTTTWTEGAWR
jgi:hypothetical protein